MSGLKNTEGEEREKKLEKCATENNERTEKICLIVSGGTIDEKVLKRALEDGYDLLIAADSGLDALTCVGIVPDVICGDFDSAKTPLSENAHKSKIYRFNPEKDYTDTELAVNLAMEYGYRSIRLLGATGTRHDHFLGNIAVMAGALNKGCRIIIEDGHNRIRMINKNESFIRSGLIGDYISFIPYGKTAVGVSLKGFKYEVDNRDFTCFESIGVSNEAADDELFVGIMDGMLLMIESWD